MKAVALSPYCVKTIWGGKNLFLKYGKKDFENIAEAWELSGCPGKESRICGGKYDGYTVSDFISAEGKEILGKKAEIFDKFPLLIKLIDSADSLSIQVHPDDEKAKLLGADGGKTEMWVICDCVPGSYIYFGMKEKISGEVFEKAVADGTITDYLNKVDVKPGDVFFIKAGTIHAIGAGITICEIQQTSTTTYRLYDYQRKDKDGNMRELHVEKGIIAADLEVKTDFYEKGYIQGNEKVMVSCPFFTTSVISVDGEKDIFVNGDSFASLTVTEGSGEIETCDETIKVTKGNTVFVYADAGKVNFKGKMNIVKATV